MGFLQEFREIDFFAIAIALIASAAFYYDSIWAFSASALAEAQAGFGSGAPILLLAALALVAIIGCAFSIRSALTARRPARYQVLLMYVSALLALIPLSLVCLVSLGRETISKESIESAALMAFPIVTIIRSWALIKAFVSSDKAGISDFEANANPIQAFPAAAIVLVVAVGVRFVLPGQPLLAVLAVYQCSSYAISMLMLERPPNKGNKAKRRRGK